MGNSHQQAMLGLVDTGLIQIILHNFPMLYSKINQLMDDFLIADFFLSVIVHFTDFSPPQIEELLTR